MKKRLLAGIVSVLALLTLCACSGKTSAPGDTSEPDADAETVDSAPAGMTKGAPTITVEDITVQDILTANMMGPLAMIYGSVRADYVRPQTQQYDLVMEYADTQYLYRQFIGEEDLYALNGSSGYCRFPNSEYSALLEVEPSFTSGHCFALDPDVTELELIDSVEDNGDEIIVTTTLDTELLRPMYEYDIYGFPYDDGDELEKVYTLNEDLVMLNVVTTLVHADGTREESETVMMSYDVEMPEGAAALAARKNTDNPYVVTVTLDPGAPEELTVSATAQKGDPVLYNLPVGYYILYADPECTIPAEENSSLENDITYYSVMEADGEWAD